MKYVLSCVRMLSSVLVVHHLDISMSMMVFSWSRCCDLFLVSVKSVAGKSDMVLLSFHWDTEGVVWNVVRCILFVWITIVACP